MIHNVDHSKNRTFDIGLKDIEMMINKAHNFSNGKYRLCSHTAADEEVHEMFIVHPRNTYVRPHEHVNKTESILIIKGELNFIEFNRNGDVKKNIKMSEINSDEKFYHSSKAGLYHSLWFKSDWVVFLEITKGPFIANETIYAPWSPAQALTEQGLDFISSKLF